MFPHVNTELYRSFFLESGELVKIFDLFDFPQSKRPLIRRHQLIARKPTTPLREAADTGHGHFH